MSFMSFVEIGVERQYDARNIFEAKKAFKKSCKICSKTGKHIECDRCRIDAAHNAIIEIFSVKTLH